MRDWSYKEMIVITINSKKEDRRVQEKLFEYGCYWNHNNVDNEVKYYGGLYTSFVLFIDVDKSITYGGLNTRNRYIIEGRAKEIKANQLFHKKWSELIC